MRRFFLTVFVGLFLASVAWAQERTCFLCESSIYEAKDIVWYGGKTFCSKDCRSEHHLDKFRCKICNERYEPKSRSAVRRNGPVTFLRSSPGRTDGYCDFCRDGVRDGSIDPVKDRYKPDRPERSQPAMVPAAPAGEIARADDNEDDEASGSYLKWVLGFAVGGILLLARLIKG